MNFKNVICYCTGLTKENLKKIVFENSFSLQKIIQKTNASNFCGNCYQDLSNYFFYYKYQKKICYEKNYCLFE